MMEIRAIRRMKLKSEIRERCVRRDEGGNVCKGREAISRKSVRKGDYSMAALLREAMLM